MQSCDFEAGQITSTKISKLTSKILIITSIFNQKKSKLKKKLKARDYCTTRVAIKEHI